MFKRETINTQGLVFAAALKNRLWRFRFLRFLVVGGMNTIFGYGVFFLVWYATAQAMVALAVAMGLGVLFNFVTSGRIVFDNRDPGRLWRFIAVYSGLFIVNAVALKLTIAAGMNAAAGPATLLLPMVILSYLGNRNIVFFHKGRDAGGTP